MPRLASSCLSLVGLFEKYRPPPVPWVMGWATGEVVFGRGDLERSWKVLAEPIVGPLGLRSPLRATMKSSSVSATGL